MDQSEIMQYIPVLMLGLLAICFSFGTLVLSVWFGKKGKRTPIKDTAYECGVSLSVGSGLSGHAQNESRADFRSDGFVSRRAVYRLPLRAQEARLRVEKLIGLEG
jgi:hypothetical protein